MADALYDFVTSLMPAGGPAGVEFAGTDLAFLDLGAVGGAWEKNAGTVETSTTWSKFGGKSLRFNGGGTLSRSDLKVAAFGAGPFCIEGWLNADPTQPVNSIFFGAWLSANHLWQSDSLYLTADPKDGGAVRLALFAHNFSPTNAVLSSTTNPLTAGPIHFAVTRDASDVWRLFVGGALQDSRTWTGSVNDGVTARPATLGGNTYLPGSGQDSFMNGYLDDFRITIGAPRYTSAFSVPTAAFEYVRSARATPQYLNRQLPLGAYPAQAGGRYVSAAGAIRRDAIFLGTGVVSGTVKQKATPANAPLVRKVLLLDESTNLVMREVWSAPLTGNYAFTHLPLGRRYSVVTYDYEQNYRAVVADNLEPAAA